MQHRHFVSKQLYWFFPEMQNSCLSSQFSTFSETRFFRFQSSGSLGVRFFQSYNMTTDAASPRMLHHHLFWTWCVRIYIETNMHHFVSGFSSAKIQIPQLKSTTAIQLCNDSSFHDDLVELYSVSIVDCTGYYYILGSFFFPFLPLWLRLSWLQSSCPYPIRFQPHFSTISGGKRDVDNQHHQYYCMFSLTIFELLVSTSSHLRVTVSTLGVGIIVDLYDDPTHWFLSRFFLIALRLFLIQRFSWLFRHQTILSFPFSRLKANVFANSFDSFTLSTRSAPDRLVISFWLATSSTAHLGSQPDQLQGQRHRLATWSTAWTLSSTQFVGKANYHRDRFSASNELCICLEFQLALISPRIILHSFLAIIASHCKSFWNTNQQSSYFRVSDRNVCYYYKSLEISHFNFTALNIQIFHAIYLVFDTFLILSLPSHGGKDVVATTLINHSSHLLFAAAISRCLSFVPFSVSSHFLENCNFLLILRSRAQAESRSVFTRCLSLSVSCFLS